MRREAGVAFGTANTTCSDADPSEAILAVRGVHGMMRPMPGTNLTRDEAATRSAILSVTTYQVELDLADSEKTDTTTFASSTAITFDAEPGSSTFADLVAAEVSSITLNGVDLDPARVWADARIRLDGLAAHNELRISARCRFSHS